MRSASTASESSLRSAAPPIRRASVRPVARPRWRLPKRRLLRPRHPPHTLRQRVRAVARCVASTSDAALRAKGAHHRPFGPEHRRRHPPAGQHLIVEFLNTTLPDNLERRLDVIRLRDARPTIDDGHRAQRRAWSIEPQGPVGTHRPTRPTTASSSRSSRQEDPNRLIQGTQGYTRREAVAQFPERRSARSAAGHRRFHRPEHHHQRHRRRQPHAAPEGRAMGPGAGHHPAGQGAGHAQERQRRAGSRRATSSPPRKSSRSKAQAQIAELEPLRTETSSELSEGRRSAASCWPTTSSGLLSKRGSVAVDPRTNTIFVQDTAAKPGRGASPDPEDRRPGAAGPDRVPHRRSATTSSRAASACGSGARPAIRHSSPAPACTGRAAASARCRPPGRVAR